MAGEDDPAPSTPAPQPNAPSSSGSNSGSLSGLPWHLIPAFKPGETDINEYSRKLEFLANIWPREHLSHLAPRACLLCEGTAFNKVVRLSPDKLKVQSDEGIKLVVATLGGVWGQSKLERKYERFERAIFTTLQKADETHASYLARHEVQYEEMISLGATLEEMRAYILIRNSGLTAEDKKRIIVEAKGKLEYSKVTEALQLLGSRFFGEVQSGSGSKHQGRTKTYDINYVDDEEFDNEQPDESALFSFDTGTDELPLDIFLAEEDPDALLVQSFEESVIDTLQADQEIAQCYTAYVDARKRLTERSKGRGFWGNPQNSKGGKSKGKGKNKGGFQNRFRKPLQQRILESNCRLCHQKGHWRAECPMRHKLANNASSSNPAPASAFAGLAAAEHGESDHPDHDDGDVPSADAIPFADQECVFMIHHQSFHSPLHHHASHKIGHQLKSKWKTILHNHQSRRFPPQGSSLPSATPAIRTMKTETKPTVASQHRDPLSKEQVTALNPEETHPRHCEESANFVTHGTSGIVDLGASMSVIGEQEFRELCKCLPQTLRANMKEAPCQVSFRFGNNSSVVGKRSVYFPVGSKWIKVIVVPSQTPFLIANSVFRNLGPVIDTQDSTIYFKSLDRSIPMTLTERKLYRIDLLDLLQVREKSAFTAVLTGPEPTQSIESKPHTKHEETPLSCVATLDHAHAENQSQTHRSHPCVGPKHFLHSATFRTVSHHGAAERKPQLRPAGQPSQGCLQVGDSSGGRQSRDDETHRRNEPEDVGERDHSIRKDSPRQDICRNEGRDGLHGLHRGQVQGQQESRAPEVSQVHPTPCRTVGSCQDEALSAKSQGQESGLSNGNRTSGGRPDTDIVRGRVGTSPSTSRDATTRDDGHAQPDGSTRGGHAASPRTSHSEERDVKETIPVHQLRGHELADICESWLAHEHHTSSPEKHTMEVGEKDVGEHIFHTQSTNWVEQEMWDYFRSRGCVLGSKHWSKNHAHILEVYCDPESQLTLQDSWSQSRSTLFLEWGFDHQRGP